VANGRGVAIAGNKIYYTELSGTDIDIFGPTDYIRIAPYNGGVGGADIATLPNPDPNYGVQDLAFFGGYLYAMTGYNGPNQPDTVPTVWKLDPNTGAVISSVAISGSATSDSDGFTVLPNGNFLINHGDAKNSYDQYNPVTGAMIAGTNLVVLDAAGSPFTFSTGVDIAPDGASLYFATDFNSITQTGLAGNWLATFSTDGFNQFEDIALPQAAVPLSPSMLLFGTGLLGLAGLGRRKFVKS
jgi:hypothetical protein